MNLTQEEWQKIKAQAKEIPEHKLSLSQRFKLYLKVKKILAIIFMFSLLIPSMMVFAQEVPVVPTTQVWVVIPTRDVYWIGEEITGAINGSVNTTVLIELRPIFNGTVLNATYQSYTQTNANGSITFSIRKIDDPGDYRLQILVNQMVVCFVDVRYDYDAQRWNEIQFEKQEYINQQNADAMMNRTLADGYLKQENDNTFLFLIVVVIAFAVYVICTIELQLNYHIYKRKKACKRPNRVAGWLLHDTNQEFFHQAGGIIFDKPPVLPSKINGEDLTWSGLVGKNTREIIHSFDLRMKNRKTPVRKTAPQGTKSKFFRKRERKEIIKANTPVVPVKAEKPVKSKPIESGIDGVKIIPLEEKVSPVLVDEKGE